MLRVAVAPPAPAQTAVHYRVTANTAWFYQDVGGRRIAQLVRGAVLTAGPANATRTDWLPMTLDGANPGKAKVKAKARDRAVRLGKVDKPATLSALRAMRAAVASATATSIAARTRANHPSLA